MPPRMSVLNFLVVLVLITFVALRHSASIFAPHSGSSASADFDHEAGRWSETAGTTTTGLSALWHRAMLMKLWLLDVQADSWQLMRKQTDAESDVLEARFHVANAEVLSAAMNDTQKAARELARADDELREALALVPDGVKLSLEGIRKELSAASSLRRSEVEATAERIKAELDGVVAALEVNRPVSSSHSSLVNG